MHVNTSASLFVASSLFCLGSSLPFFAREVALKPRATYSVQNVDGGSAATTDTSGQGEVTVSKTILTTATPSVETVIHTATQPASTNTIISTQTVEVPIATETFAVTITPTAITVTKTETSISTIGIPTTIIIQPTSTASPSRTSTVDGTIPEGTPSSTTGGNISAASITTSPLGQSTLSVSTVETSYISTFTTASSASTTSYDDGQWHTTYPWSNSTTALGARRAPLPRMPTRSFGSGSSDGIVGSVLRFLRRFSSGINIPHV